MKKIILLIFAALLISCEHENRTYTLKYVVFYPNYNDTVTITSDTKFYWGCDRGNNYIKKGGITGSDYYAGSAPYKILEYTYVENKK